MQVVFITGVSSGIGKATANAFVKAGYRVFGASRNSKSGVKIAGVEMLKLDVRSDASVESAVNEVLERAGRIDVLVNNAGIGVIGAGEESTAEQAKMLFDTNVFGLMRVTRAVLPHMRSRKAGRVINMSSIQGVIPAPFMTLYCASKHAVEGYSESLDHEVRTQGIRVALIEPAYTKTSFHDDLVKADAMLSEYDTGRSTVADIQRVVMSTAETPETVAAAVLKAARAKKPKLRYPAGALAARLAFLRRHAPAAIFDDGVRKHLKLGA